MFCVDENYLFSVVVCFFCAKPVERLKCKICIAKHAHSKICLLNLLKTEGVRCGKNKGGQAGKKTLPPTTFFCSTPPPPGNF